MSSSMCFKTSETLLLFSEIAQGEIETRSKFIVAVELE